MSKVILGKHMAVIAARADQERIRRFYGDVLGCQANVASAEVDRFQMDDVHIVFVYQDAALAEHDFLKAMFLELATENVEDMRRKLLAFGVKVIEMPDRHFYFHAPGGQAFKLVGIDEDLSLYETSTSSKPGAAALMS